MLCRIDQKSLLYPSSEVPKPHRCMGGKLSGELPTPLSRMRYRACEPCRPLSSASAVSGMRATCSAMSFTTSTKMSTWRQSIGQTNSRSVLARRNLTTDHRRSKRVQDPLSCSCAENYLAQGPRASTHPTCIIKDDPTLRGLVVVSDRRSEAMASRQREVREGRRQAGTSPPPTYARRSRSIGPHCRRTPQHG